MGRKEAEEDGINCEFRASVEIPYYRNTQRWIYTIPCSLCGREYEAVIYSRTRVRLCPECKRAILVQRKKIKAEAHPVDKAAKRYETAVDRIRKQVKDFSKYDRAVYGARKALEKYGSIPEAMTAIELLYLGYPFVPQYRVGRYKVDFFIPSINTALEVDGTIYHQHENEKRDMCLQLALGQGAKIVHVPAETLEKRITLLKRIIEKRDKTAVITGHLNGVY